MIVDVTAELLAQIVFVALGIVIWCMRAPQTPAAGSLTTLFTAGLLFAAAAGGLFVVLQRQGHRLTARLAPRLLPAAVAGAAAVGAALDAIYRSPGRVALSAALHLAGWMASAAGVWLAFRLIGVHVDLAPVTAIESLICAARSAAVFIPNALGVQEAAYAFVAPLFGVGAEFGLAVSLLKRARDIAVGVPILLVWQTVEGRRGARRGTRRAPLVQHAALANQRSASSNARSGGRQRYPNLPPPCRSRSTCACRHAHASRVTRRCVLRAAKPRPDTQPAARQRTADARPAAGEPAICCSIVRKVMSPPPKIAFAGGAALEGQQMSGGNVVNGITLSPVST